MTTVAAPGLLARLEILRERRPGLARLLDSLAVGDPGNPGWPDPATVLPVFERLDAIDSGSRHRTYDALMRLLSTFPATPESTWKAAVLANMFAVITGGEAEDYAHTAVLAQSGDGRIAPLQRDLDDLLGIGPSRPCVTSAVQRLAHTAHIRQLLLRGGYDEVQADLIATRCADAAFWLLMEDLDPSDPAPIPRSPEALRLVVDGHGVDAWRRVLANVSGNPWGPHVALLADLARAADLPVLAQAIEACARVYRKRLEDDERLAVAREIRRLVATSGLSQRQFAKHVGTSAPRMSTYSNGVVTPSAAMMLRISKTSTYLAGGTDAPRWPGSLELPPGEPVAG